MKALRVLTGSHAGAQIRLMPGTYRVGAEEDADVCISDWQVASMSLELGEDGITRFRQTSSDEVLVADFVAVPFGDVVICVGPDDASWPRDLDLLEGLWKTAHINDEPQQEDAVQTPPPAHGKALRTAGVALACTALVGALMAAGVMLAGTQATQAAIVKFDAGAASQQITLALHQAGLTDLHAAAQADKITVHGMVASAGDNDKARQIFDQLARGKVVRKYDIADVDVDNLRQSLGDFATQVDYMGHGVFKVSGKVQSLQHFRDVLATVKSDLGANIKRIDVDVKEVRTPIASVDYSEVVETNGVHYVQTTDGTKHFFYTAESGNGSKKDHVTD